MSDRIVSRDSGSCEMVKFFFHVQGIMKHLMDDILPDMLMNLDQKTLEMTVEACEDFRTCFQVFVKLCTVISRKKLFTSSVQSLNSSTAVSRQESPIPAQLLETKSFLPSTPSGELHKNDVLKKTFFTTSTQSLNSSTSTSRQGSPVPSQLPERVAFLPVNPLEELNRNNASRDGLKQLFIAARSHQNVLMNFYYCGVCSFPATDLKVWQDHLTGEAHKLTWELQGANKQYKVYNCSLCGFFCFDEPSQLKLLSTMLEHKQLHDVIATTKHQNSNAPQNPPPKQKKPEPHHETQVSSCVVNQSQQNPPHCSTQLSGKIRWELIIYLCTSSVAFCDPCKMIVPVESWSVHQSLPEHSSLLDANPSKFQTCACPLCPFSAVLPQDDVHGIMLAHCKYYHPASNMTADLLKTGLVVGPAKKTKKKRNKKQKSSHSTLDDLQPNENEITDDLQNASHSDGSSKSPQDVFVDAPQEISEPETPKEAPENLFTVDTVFTRLIAFKKQYSSPSSCHFTGVCFLCPPGVVENAFEWMDHINLHPADDDQNEVQCSSCNSSFFGDVKAIRQTVLKHPEHDRLHKIYSFR